MHDTPAEIETLLNARYAAMTPEEKLRIVGQMYDEAMSLMEAGIRRRHPDISAEELRVAIFRRMYADCFTEAEMLRIERAIVQRFVPLADKETT